MFRSVVGIEGNKGGESGTRKAEAVAKHLGGLTNANGAWPTRLLSNPCRAQAHALRSPLALTVAAAAPGGPRPAGGDASEQLPACGDGAADGRWVRTACDGDCERLKGGERRRDRAKRSDPDWDFGYEWRPRACSYDRHTPESLKQCLARRSVDVVFLSGDSVMQACTPAFYEKLGGHVLDPPEKVANAAGIQVQSVSMTMSADGKALKNLLKRLEGVKKDKLGVVLSNFGIQHVQWGKSLADAEATLKPFSRDAFDRLHCDRPDVRTQFVQFGGIAVHGFREPYVTYNRSRSYSDLFRAHLAPLHWDFVDAWLPTASRPEGAQDGMHYRPPTCSALMDVFFHLLCRDGATEQRGCAAASS